MTEQTGKIGWIDITVDDAGALRDFYADVVGLRPEPVSMGDYDDFNMTMPGRSLLPPSAWQMPQTGSPLPGKVILKSS